MSSSKTDYTGGQIQFRQGDINEQHDLAFGDVLVWKGWIDHRVLPVIQGERDVFVVEWWLGEDCAVSNDPRAKDDLRTLEPVEIKLRRWGRGLDKCKDKTLKQQVAQRFKVFA